MEQATVAWARKKWLEENWQGDCAVPQPQTAQQFRPASSPTIHLFDEQVLELPTCWKTVVLTERTGKIHHDVKKI
jgi:hypothetical protein